MTWGRAERVGLFSIPKNLWLYLLISVRRATAVGVVTGAAIEPAAVTRRSNVNGYLLHKD
jgi:hypothetical protein